MKKEINNKLLCFIVIGLSILPAFLGAVENMGGPKAFVSQDRYEFEAVPEGTLVAYEFEIENSGGDVLSIEKAVSSCSCLSVESYDDMIRPGGFGRVSVSLDTDGYGGGKVVRTVTLLTSDPDTPQLTLIVSGRVDKTYSIDPEIVKLTGKANEHVAATVTIFPEEMYEFKVLGIRTKNDEYIECSFDEIVEDGRCGYLLTIQSKKKEKGLFFDKIFVDTDSTVVPELSIGVFGKIEASG